MCTIDTRDQQRFVLHPGLFFCRPPVDGPRLRRDGVRIRSRPQAPPKPDIRDDNTISKHALPSSHLASCSRQRPIRLLAPPMNVIRFPFTNAPSSSYRSFQSTYFPFHAQPVALLVVDGQIDLQPAPRQRQNVVIGWRNRLGGRGSRRFCVPGEKGKQAQSGARASPPATTFRVKGWARIH
jgi:hypothetical protein